MGFLWQLLPGAREARTQLIVGYAWLFALGVWFGVPELPPEGNLAEMAVVVGKVGAGIALSFVAFLFGSMLDDMTGRVQHYLLPTAPPSTLMEFAHEAPGPGLQLLTELEMRSEVERGLASLDRSKSEIQLRLGLIPPAFAISVYAASVQWYWGVASAVAVLAIGAQLLLRMRDAWKAGEELLDLRQQFLVVARERHG